MGYAGQITLKAINYVIFKGVERDEVLYGSWLHDCHRSKYPPSAFAVLVVLVERCSSQISPTVDFDRG
jgi:hypothetical protein